MRIIVESEHGTLIDEYEVETSNGTEALETYLKEQCPVLVEGDVIQLRNW